MPKSKPLYRVPSMSEIRAIKPNGLTVVSTFSGCGGSSLGLRMAGFRVLWANEFINDARLCYGVNKGMGTILTGKDIRDVSSDDIIAQIKEMHGVGRGEVDLLEGSPPCASFSTAGKRHRHWGDVKKYSSTVQRTDDLFMEFVRILDGLRPRAFVAENVAGLVKGTAKGWFLMILKALKDCGYRVSCKMLDAQWLGVPQERKRTIFVGVRYDLEYRDLKSETIWPIIPFHPSPLPFRFTVRDAIPWIGMSSTEPKTTESIPHVEPESDMTGYAVGRELDKLGPGDASKKYFQLVRAPLDAPCPTITQRGGDATCASVCHPLERRKFSIAELKRLCGFPDDFVLTGTYEQQYERLGRAVPPVMYWHVGRVIRDQILFKADGKKPWRRDPQCLLDTISCE